MNPFILLSKGRVEKKCGNFQTFADPPKDHSLKWLKTPINAF